MIEYIYSEDLINNELSIVPLRVVQINNYIHEIPDQGKRMSFSIFFEGTTNGHKFKKNTLYLGHSWNDPNDMEFNLGLGGMRDRFNDYFPHEIKDPFQSEALAVGKVIPSEMKGKSLGNTWFFADKLGAENSLKYATLEDFLNPPSI